MEYKWNDTENENTVNNNLGNIGNHAMEQNGMEENHMEQNNHLGQNDYLAQNSNSANAANDAYANQEYNSNNYEQKEQEGGSQRTYTTGTYGTSQEGNPSYTENQEYTGQASSDWNQANTEQGAYAQWQPAGQEPKKEKKKKKNSGMKRQHGFGMVVAKCAGLAVVFGLVSSTVFYGTGLAFQQTTSANRVSQETSTAVGKNKVTVNNGNLSATNVSTATTVTDVSDIVENVMPSIVSITNMAQTQDVDFFGRYYQRETPNAGSGIIIGQTEDEIYVATNNHVVANSNQLTVNFVDDQQVTGEIKGTDPSTDLAVVSVKVKDIPSDTMEKIKVATIGNSDDVKVGQSVVAIGNALGYGQSVTTGVVSALDREVTLQDENTGETITNDLLQTDAAINPGNSGGALLNMNGELVGINSAKYSDTQVEGMGYAIPISAAEPIINDLITRELVDESNSAFLGVSGQDVTGELSKNFGMPEGLYITMVTEKSAAEQAGIKNGDVLTEFDGRAVKSMESLMDIMQYYAAGTEVEITLQVNENGEWQEQKVTATLGRKNN